MTTKEFRKSIEDLVYNIMDYFDSTGYNTDYYKKLFKPMNDDEFIKYIDNFLGDPDEYFTVEITPFKSEQMPKFSNYEKAAKLLDLELEEYVRMPYFNEGTDIKEHTRTMTKVPVGKLHIKRLQQMLSKKNKVTTSIEVRDQRKGQVTGEDKGAKLSDADVLALSAINMNYTLKELLGPRADDYKAKEYMIESIKKYGYVNLKDLPNDIESKTAINTLNIYLLGAGLINDLVSDSYVLPITKKKYRKEV